MLYLLLLKFLTDAVTSTAEVSNDAVTSTAEVSNDAVTSSSSSSFFSLLARLHL